MLVSFPVALAMFAQAAAATPPASGTTPVPQAPKTTSASSASTADNCPPPAPNSTQIVICAERPQGYRLNQDVMEAKRQIRNHSQPVRPGGTVRPDCATVGPQPCVSAGINLIGVALTAAQMAERLAKGQEVGSMFMTDPHPTEYQLYQMAKARREAEEAQKAADAKAQAASAAAKAPAVDPTLEGQPAQQSSHE
jgi:hypothetical protein